MSWSIAEIFLSPYQLLGLYALCLLFPTCIFPRVVQEACDGIAAGVKGDKLSPVDEPLEWLSRILHF